MSSSEIPSITTERLALDQLFARAVRSLHELVENDVTAENDTYLSSLAYTGPRDLIDKYSSQIQNRIEDQLGVISFEYEGMDIARFNTLHQRPIPKKQQYYPDIDRTYEVEAETYPDIAYSGIRDLVSALYECNSSCEVEQKSIDLVCATIIRGYYLHALHERNPELVTREDLQIISELYRQNILGALRQPSLVKQANIQRLGHTAAC